MNPEKLNTLQENINLAEKEYKNNPTIENENNLIIAKDEIEIYLKMNTEKDYK